jgi:hypothetical protein
MTPAFAWALLLSPLLLPGPQHFTLTAAFEPPAKAGQDAAVAVTFSGTDPMIHINEEPAPRLKLDPLQTVLVDKQKAASGKGPDFDPDTARSLDLAEPVRFPVAFSPTAPKGPQVVKATVIYFYCSKREGWCRRGSTEVEVPLTVR